MVDEELIFNNEEEGFKWFKNLTLTEYIQKETLFFNNNCLPALDNIIALRIEKDKKTLSYVLYDTNFHDIIEDCGSYEACVVKIDILKTKRMLENKQNHEKEH